MCSFVRQPAPCLYCHACEHVARKPTIPSCSCHCYVYCKACIEPVKEKGDLCPVCDNKIDNLMAHTNYEKEIEMLEVECTNKTKGCKWSGQLKLLDYHLLAENKAGCKYVEVQCPKRCGLKVEKVHIGAHLNSDCIERQYTCQHCNKEGTYRSISTEHWPECEYIPITCPNMCGMSYEQIMQEEHDKTCPHFTVECLYRDTGCTAKFQRKDQEAHLKENIQQHLDFTMKMHQELKAKQEETKEIYAKLVKQGEEFAEKLKVVERQQAEAVQRHEAKRTTMIRNFEIQLSLKESIIKTLQENQKSTMNACVRQSIQSFRLHTGIWPYHLTMSGYKKLQHENDIWYSSHMLTHPLGYTFLITVRPNGYEDSKGNAVGVWLRSCKGLYDKCLKWPAQVAITLQLLNQLGDCEADHVTNTTLFELKQVSDTAEVHVYIAPFSLSYIPHEDLNYNTERKTQYLKDDCLKFKIKSIELR